MPITLNPPLTPVELIGNTPMLKVTRLDTGPCELFLKLEANNPGGSIKDRIGLSMIRAAEEAGLVGPTQKKLVEATNLVGLRLLDHVIIAKKGTFSFMVAGLLR